MIRLQTEDTLSVKKETKLPAREISWVQQGKEEDDLPCKMRLQFARGAWGYQRMSR